MKKYTKKLPWVDPDGRRGFEILEINAPRPLTSYGFGNHCLYNLKRTQQEAKILVLRIWTIIAFCNVTGLRPAQGASYLPNPPEGFGHTSYWHTPNKRLILTTEPDASGASIIFRSCKELNWPAIDCSSNFDQYEGGTASKKLILVSPEGALIEPYASALVRWSMPRPCLAHSR